MSVSDSVHADAVKACISRVSGETRTLSTALLLEVLTDEGRMEAWEAKAVLECWTSKAGKQCAAEVDYDAFVEWCFTTQQPSVPILSAHFMVPWLPGPLRLPVHENMTVQSILGLLAAQLHLEPSDVSYLRIKDGDATKKVGQTELARGLVDLAEPAVVIVNKVPAGFEGHGCPWAKELVTIPEDYKNLGFRIPKTEQRAMRLSQLRALGCFLETLLPAAEIRDIFGNRVLYRLSEAGPSSSGHIEVNMYVICDKVVKPLTQPFSCSFVELISTDAQPPTNFVSHFWGNPYWQTLKLIDFHAASRQWGGEDPTYWICTFANNQHELDELAAELDDTPFVKAIHHVDCKGTVALLDIAVTTFKRIWCVLENYVSNGEKARAAGKKYDLAAWVSEGTQFAGNTAKEMKAVPAKPALQLDLGDGTFKEVLPDREGTGGSFGVFPWAVSSTGVFMDLTKAEASRESDRVGILHYVANTSPEARSLPPPVQHPNYDSLNKAARRRFVPNALYDFARDGENGKIMQVLDEFPEEANARIWDGAAPLFRAAFSCRLDTVRLLIERRADVNQTKGGGYSTVFYCAWYSKLESLNLLISFQGDVNLGTDRQISPTWIAAEHEQPESLKILIAARADINAAANLNEAWLRPFDANEVNVTPIAMAAEKGSLESIELLIAHGADLHASSAAGTTPLCRAAQCGHLQAVRILLAARADVNSSQIEGCMHSPLTAAALRGHAEVCRALLQCRADLTHKAQPLLLAEGNDLGTSGGNAIEIAREKEHMSALEVLTAA